MVLAPLGEAGWGQVVKKKPELRKLPLPYEVKKTMPALFDNSGVLEVPHLNYYRLVQDTDISDRKQIFSSVRFLQLNER